MRTWTRTTGVTTIDFFGLLTGELKMCYIVPFFLFLKTVFLYLFTTKIASRTSSLKSDWYYFKKDKRIVGTFYVDISGLLFLACLYKNTWRVIALTMTSVIASEFHWIFKFLVKFCKSLYPLNLWMELVKTCPFGTEVLCCTNPTFHFKDFLVIVFKRLYISQSLNGSSWRLAWH